nr:unnamed protein product [Callosobruchus chinensis]
MPSNSSNRVQTKNLLALKYNLQQHRTNDYQYEASVILENEYYEMYWDRTIITDGRLEHNRPDIVVKDERNKEVRYS